jgi:hypothetical protein
MRIDISNRVGTTSNFGGFRDLLDKFSGAAAGYSLRKLSRSATNAVRVRRSSDNTEQDIGFVGAGLDTAALLAFVGTGASDNGFVTTWYDQAGSNDATQATASNQPQIVLNGNLITENGKVAVQFDGTNTFFAISQDITGEDFAAYAIFKPIAQDPAQDGWIFDNLTSYGRGLLHDDYLSGRVTLISDTSSTSAIRVRSDITTDLTLITALIDNETPSGGSVDIFRDGILEDNFSGDVPYQENTFVQYIGAGSSSPSEVFNGYMMELIVYTANGFVKSGKTKQTQIETNINNYYNIYS